MGEAEQLERALRLSGTLLEFFGLLSVVWDLNSTLRKLGLAGLGAQIGATWRRIRYKIRRKRTISASVMEAASARATLTGHGASLRVQALSLDDRVLNLEDRMRRQEKEYTELSNQIGDRIEGLNDRIDEARKDARADNDALKEKVNSIVTGGINAKVAGFVFVAFGVVLANMSEEIASWWLAAF